MRMFLANYLMNTKVPLSINQVHRFGLGDSIPRMYHRVAGKEIDTTNAELTLALRDKVMRGIVANNADINFVKTHNTNNRAFGVDLIDPKYTKLAIYIVRNPLDMVLSYARHFDLSHEEAVQAINSPENANAPDHTSVWQFLGSWNDHVRYWTEAKGFPVIVLRYEDMLDSPQENFGKALTGIGFDVDKDVERLERAIEFSSFKELKKQEDEQEFVEKSPYAEKFFNKGKAEQWRTDLDPDLVKRVRQANKKMMKKYGYYNG